MKKVFFLLLASLAWANLATAQKFGFMETDKILEKMPEYATALKELDQLAASWQKEVETLQEELKTLRTKYEVEKILFTNDMKTDAEKKIALKEQEVRELQTKYFGVNGMLFLKRYELMKEPLDKINKATLKVAKKKKLDFLFERNSELFGIIYAKETHNYTDYVLLELGLGEESKDTINNEKKN